jgi:GPN-loop GTPase
VHNIFEKLDKLGYHLCTVHLVDSHYCSEPHKFISTLLLSLNTMLQMGLPHVNVLSKADLFKQHESKLLFNLDFYTEVLDLKYLLEALDSTPGMSKYKKLNEAIVSMVEDYSLVSFQPLDVKRVDSIARLYKIIDKANGFAFSSNEEQNINSMLACAVGAESAQSKAANDYEPYTN